MLPFMANKDVYIAHQNFE